MLGKSSRDLDVVPYPTHKKKESLGPWTSGISPSALAFCCCSYPLQWGSLLSDVCWSELSLTLGQEDLHSPVEQVDAQLPFPLHLPVGHHSIKIPSLLIGEHLQPWDNWGFYLVTDKLALRKIVVFHLWLFMDFSYIFHNYSAMPHTVQCQKGGS